MLVKIDSQAEAAFSNDETKHNVSDVLVPPGIFGMVLPQRGHMLYSQNRSVNPLQLQMCGGLQRTKV